VSVICNGLEASVVGVLAVVRYIFLVTICILSKLYPSAQFWCKVQRSRLHAPVLGDEQIILALSMEWMTARALTL